MAEGTRTPDFWNHNPVATHENPEKNGLSENGGAPGGAPEPETGAFDPELAAVIERWPTLPQAVRTEVLAMVRAAGKWIGRCARTAGGSRGPSRSSDEVASGKENA